ncbi:hypothetical protein K227x_62010 [Rubripirellula lacrimiformis]|uniref:Uncharacterized protein n=1 Tax=Rubripirellula lacrimiformis TaxID=1930273 RepID=A0A517NL47_9BACT|nr:hypothetical protein K227x_62010 [Rubripirellula lacrimiformis]
MSAYSFFSRVPLAITGHGETELSELRNEKWLLSLQ